MNEDTTASVNPSGTLPPEMLSWGICTDHVLAVKDGLFRQGLDRETIERITRIDHMPRLQYNHIPMVNLFRMWHDAIEASGDNLLPIKTALAPHPYFYGTLFFIGMHSPNIGAALKNMHPFQKMRKTGMENYLTKDNDTFCLRVAYEGAEPSAEWVAPFMEFYMACYLYLANLYTFRRLKPFPFEIHFAHQPKAPLIDYQNLLKVKVLFGQKHNQLKGPLSVLELPNYRPDEEALQLYTRQMKTEMLAIENKSKSDFIQELKQFIHDNIEHKVTIDDCADHFGITPSTIRNRVKVIQTTYKNLYEEQKVQLAKTFLDKKSLSAEEIAKRLGFSSSSNFIRYFKLKTGYTPKQYQKNSVK